MKKPFRLEYIGETKYILIQDIMYNDERHEVFLIDWFDETDEQNFSFTIKNIGYAHKVYLDFGKDYDKSVKSSSSVMLYKRKENWRECLLKEIEQYDDMEDVDLYKALSSSYDCIKRKIYNNTEARIKVNNDSTHLLDMNEIMCKIMFPIDDIKGDVAFYYIYKDRYVIVKEFVYDKIYVFDTHNKENATKLYNVFRVECHVCRLNIKPVNENSAMYKVSIASDEERIKIILDENADKNLVEKAKGNIK